VKFTIIHIEPLSGDRAQVYTLKYEGKDVTELQGFFYKFQDTHPEVINETVQRIYNISNRNGIQDISFKRESPESHNVFRILETEELRLYCIMYSNILLLFGTGGKKRHNTKKNVENPALVKIINSLMDIEDAIKSKLDSGDIKITLKGFEGNLKDIEIKGKK